MLSTLFQVGCLSKIGASKSCNNRNIYRILPSTVISNVPRRERHHINKILIANRGEIGCRVVRTARKMGLLTTAVYSDVDRDSMLVYLADEAINLGKSPVADSYMNKDKLIEAAKRCGAQAIHPGYGFLSENHEFADLCHSNGLIFIGPPASAIKSMGIKSIAKQIMSSAGVPVVPGYHGENQEDAFLLDQATKVGFPVMIKAIKGGGGKGMRICLRGEDFLDNLESARRESLKSFGDESVLIEKYISNPRHVEVQIFADQLGNCVYLFERDCSVQRRHQKIIEEAPAPEIDEATRVKLGEAAVRAAQAVNYVGAGTVEFIYDPDTKQFYFMEMNTRIQVEHPVTEMITGLDLVEWQIHVARGDRLPMTQNQIRLSGHSFEARIYAENPDENFMPGAGKVEKMFLPNVEENVRIETGLRSGDQVVVHYDPMIAKLIVWDSDRDQALIKLRSMLRKFNVIGLKTNANFLLRLASHPQFIRGNVHTDFIQEHQSDLLPSSPQPSKLIMGTAAIGLFIRDKTGSTEATLSLVGDSFRLHGTMPSTRRYVLQWQDQQFVISIKQLCQEEYQVEIDGQSIGVFHSKLDYQTDTIRIGQDGLTQVFRHMVSNSHILVFSNDGSYDFELKVKDCIVSGSSLSLDSSDQGMSLSAPMPGVIEKIMVKEGQVIEAGTTVLVMMAMKMEHLIKANKRSVVEKILFKTGESVPKGSKLVRLRTPESAAS